MNIRIDPEFKSHIPPLRSDERALLEQSLSEQGCRDPLVVWQGTLLDGHNRYEICARLDLVYQTTEAVGIETREQAIAWIEDNQLGRRNLTADQFRYFLGRQFERRKGARGGNTSNRQNVALEVASEHGVSDRTVERAGTYSRDLDQVASAAGDTFRQSVLAGEGKLTSKDIHELAEGAEEIKSAGIRFESERDAEKWLKERRAEKTERQRQERNRKLAEISKGNADLSTQTKYPLIYADPPWQYENPPIGATNRAIENHYPTMTLDEICALPVNDVAMDDAVLFLWATAPKLAECIQVIEAWGFTYRTCMVWVKDKIGMGYHARNQHELLLIAKRGQVPPPAPSDRPSSVVNAARGEHSVKPAEFYDLIERMYPDLPKIELFCRSPRDGWAVWGNQSDAA